MTSGHSASRDPGAQLARWRKEFSRCFISPELLRDPIGLGFADRLPVPCRTFSLLIGLLLGACHGYQAGDPESGGKADSVGTPTHERAEVGLVIGRQPNGFSQCTGALIAPDVVLSAAHCLLGAERHEFWIVSDGRWKDDGTTGHRY